MVRLFKNRTRCIGNDNKIALNFLLLPFYFLLVFTFIFLLLSFFLILLPKMSIVIQITNLSKIYRLGEIGTGAINLSR